MIVAERPAATGIVLIIASLRGGGAERVLAELANNWAARGVPVTVITANGSADTDAYALDSKITRIALPAMPVVPWFLRPLLFWQRLRVLRQLVQATGAGVVLSFMTSSNVITILATMGLRLHVAVAERTDPALNVELSKLWRLARRLSYRFADTVVVQTATAQAWMREHIAVDAVVIPNMLRGMPDGLSRPEKLIVAVGRLAHEKGFDLLIDAFARAHQDWPDWRLCIVGEGPLREDLQQRVQRQGLLASVDMPGHATDVDQWFAKAGLVVQPSRFEGMPNAVLEAMSMGVPVIASSAGAAAVIADGVDGVLVPVEALDQLTRAIESLLADPAQRLRLGKAAREVRQRYAAEKIMPIWDACLGLN